MKMEYPKYFEFDDFVRLKKILPDYMPNEGNIREPNDIHMDRYYTQNFFYSMYIRPFGLDYIKEKAKDITDEHLKAWIDDALENLPEFIEKAIDDSKERISDILDDLNMDYLEDKLIELFQPYMPFILIFDSIKFGIDNLDLKDFQYYYILFMLLIRDEFPNDWIEDYKWYYNRCQRKESCKYYVDCSKYKKCTREVYWHHVPDRYYSHIEERYEGFIKNFDEYIKKDTETYKTEFNEFHNKYINAFLKWVSPEEKNKALAKLQEVFTQINQTNLFKKKLSIDNFGKQKPLTGIFLIKWNKVDFFDGYYLVWHPSVPYQKAVPLKVIDPNSRKIFNEINTLFLNKLEPLCVEAKDGKIIQVLNQTKLNDCITLMEHHVTMPDLKKKKNQPEIEKKEITIHEAQEICHKLKSQFLDYLCSKQLEDYNVICCIEHRVNATQALACEYSFIFTVKETNDKLYLAYENSSESRCTYIFPIAKDSWNEGIDRLYDFFASNAVNKRQLLALRHVDLELPGNYEYRRVLHSDFGSWVAKIHL